MTIDEDCPQCHHRPMELVAACCEDKAKGIRYIARCPSCGYKEPFLFDDWKRLMEA